MMRRMKKRGRERQESKREREKGRKSMWEREG